ncbi:MAG: Ig-like domain-containing protein, partial [Patescibacteria group bacterium]
MKWRGSSADRFAWSSEGRLYWASTEDLLGLMHGRIPKVQPSNGTNHPPVLADSLLSATANQPLLWQIHATDPDGDRLSFSLQVGPKGLSIDRDYGLIRWLPTETEVGVTQMVIQVSDGKANTTKTYTINVNGLPSPSLQLARNQAPTLIFDSREKFAPASPYGDGDYSVLNNPQNWPAKFPA